MNKPVERPDPNACSRCGLVTCDVASAESDPLVYEAVVTEDGYNARKRLYNARNDCWQRPAVDWQAFARDLLAARERPDPNALRRLRALCGLDDAPDGYGIHVEGKQSIEGVQRLVADLRDLLAAREPVASEIKELRERVRVAEEDAGRLAEALGLIAADDDPDDGCAWSDVAKAAIAAYRAGRG